MRARKRTSMFMFLLGLSFILYPMISKSYYDIYYRMEAEHFTEEIRNSDQQMDLSFYQEQLDYNSSGISDLAKIEVADAGFVNDSEEVGMKPKLREEGVLGILSVPKIDLTYAIRDGASDDHLANGLARLEGTSYPVGGINTNCVIAGHHGWAEKIFFLV